MKLAEIAALADGLAPVIRDLIAAAVKPLVDENADLKRQIADLCAVDHGELIRAAVDSAVAAIPVPRDGADGAPGRDGIDGKDGAPGERGMDGAPGRDGEPGNDGRDGKDGEQGKEGPPGKLAIVKEWAEGVHYEADVVAFKGGTYQARRDTAQEPGGEDWLCLAAPGRHGTDGRSLSVRGTYAEGMEYQALDVVALNGGSFIAKTDNPGQCPGPGWQLLASQGKTGKPGERGAPGRGDRGEAGPPVVAATVDDMGMLTLVNADGSSVNCDLYPLLAKVN
jgi:hypothetical protein